MLKLIILLLFVVSLGIGSYFSLKQQGDLEVAESEYKSTSAKLKNLKVVNALVQKKINSVNSTRDLEQTALDEIDAELASAKRDYEALKGELEVLDKKIENQAREAKQLESKIASVESQFADANVPIEGYEELGAQLEEKNKTLRIEAQETLPVLLDKHRARKDKQIAKLNDVSAQLASQKRRIRSNSLSSSVSAIDSSWGFITIQNNPKIEYTEGAELIVIRGDEYIGKVIIASVEKTHIIADIQKGSMVPGARVMSGDKVVFRHPVSQ